MLSKKSFLSIGMLLSWGVIVPLVYPQLLAKASETPSTTNLETTPPTEIPPTIEPRTTSPIETPTPPATNLEISPTEIPPTIEPRTTPPTNTKTLATRLVLKIKERRVYAYNNDKVLAYYQVAVGKKGWETPTGKFQIIKMLRNPIWQSPWTGKVIPAGSANPLGERWIGFWTDGKNTIGFHGTKAENLLGKAVSHGCVRMRNRDIVALFDLVQVGTPVIVQP